MLSVSITGLGRPMSSTGTTNQVRGSAGRNTGRLEISADGNDDPWFDPLVIRSSDLAPRPWSFEHRLAFSSCIPIRDQLLLREHEAIGHHSLLLRTCKLSMDLGSVEADSQSRVVISDR
jgi:hypothetical protein